MKRFVAGAMAGAAALAIGGSAQAATRFAWGASTVIQAGVRSGQSTDLLQIGCQSTTLCAALTGDGAILISTDPAAADPRWTVSRPNVPPATVTTTADAVSCPSAKLCVALDGSGDVITSSDPTAAEPAWTVSRLRGVPLGDEPNEIACPTTSLCAAVSGGTTVYVSTDPAAGARRWRIAHAESEPARRGSGTWGVDCPTAALCVVLRSDGTVLTATDPGAAHATWRASRPIRRSAQRSTLQAMSCPSARLCVLDDNRGDVIVSRDPAARRPTWRTIHLVTGALGSVSCASTTDCVVQENVGSVLTSTDPAGPATTWKLSTPLGTAALVDLTCPATTLCLAADENRPRILTSDGLRQHGPWRVTNLFAAAANWGVSCPSPSLCVAYGGHDIFTSTDPLAAAPHWRITRTGYALSSMTCPSSALCVATWLAGVDTGLETMGLLTSADPAAVGSRWTESGASAPGATDGIAAVSCPSAGLCVRGSGTDLLISTDPRDPAAPWTSTPLATTPINCIGADGTKSDCPSVVLAVSCPSTRLCFATSGAGQLFDSTDPTGGAASWRSFSYDTQSGGDEGTQSLSCPTSALCIGDDSYGGMMLSSVRPTAGPGAWRSVINTSGIGVGGGIDPVCASTTLCVGSDWAGDTFVTTDPTAPRASWSEDDVAGWTAPAGVSCPTPTVCVAVGGNQFAVGRVSPDTGRTGIR